MNNYHMRFTAGISGERFAANRTNKLLRHTAFPPQMEGQSAFVFVFAATVIRAVKILHGFCVLELIDVTQLILGGDIDGQC